MHFIVLNHTEIEFLYNKLIHKSSLQILVNHGHHVLAAEDQGEDRRDAGGGVGHLGADLRRADPRVEGRQLSAESVGRESVPDITGNLNLFADNAQDRIGSTINAQKW